MKSESGLQNKIKVLVIYNVVEKLLYGSDKEKAAEEDTIMQAKTVTNVLKKLGYQVFEMEVYDNFEEEILKWKDKVDLVFNLTEGVGNDLMKAPYVPFILESMGFNYTGCGWESLLLTMDKGKTKEHLSAYNIPTPEYAVMSEVPKKTPRNLTYPLFVKPVMSDASYGIDKNAVVHSFPQLVERVAYILEVYKMPALVEDFVDGMDVHIGVMGNDYDNLETMLPYAIIYKNLPADEYPIITFDNKFDPESHMAKNTYVVNPAPFDDTTTDEIMDLTEKVYRVSKCSGYARLDFRIDKNMKPFFLEMNANPSLDPESGFIISAQEKGMDYNAFIDKIAQYGLERRDAYAQIYKTI